MITGSIARRYAKALVAIGEEKDAMLGLVREVQRVAEVWDGSDILRQASTSPLLPQWERRKVLSSVVERLGVSAVCKNFVNLLFDRGKLGELPAISREVGNLSDLKENRLRVEVAAPVALSEDVLMRLRAGLARRTGKTVVVTERRDPELLGGVVATVGGVMYDGSLRTSLRQLKESMLGRAR
ncbi:MAG: ATP synthase F1 subunit delta [Myxococcota bacterium]|jgi:F-type H+-transporting ATPase subunit delta|nr:ATP synthase F1 subunit delta [Myxococcota bacterium]